MKKKFDERQEQQINQIGTISFLVMFLACPVVILFQMVFLDISISDVIGETVIMLAGGVVYLAGSMKSGIWTGSGNKSVWKNVIESVVFSGIFTLLYAVIIGKKAGSHDITKYVALFFIGITVLCFVVLTALEWFSRRQEKRQEDKYSD